VTSRSVVVLRTIFMVTAVMASWGKRHHCGCEAHVVSLWGGAEVSFFDLLLVAANTRHGAVAVLPSPVAQPQH